MATSSLKGSSRLSPRYYRCRDICSPEVPSLTGLLHGETVGDVQVAEGLRGRDRERVANKVGQGRADRKTVRGRRSVDKTGQVRAASKEAQDRVVDKTDQVRADSQVAQDQVVDKTDQARADNQAVRDQVVDKTGQARADSQAALDEAAKCQLDSYSL